MTSSAAVSELRYDRNCRFCGNAFTVDWARRRSVYCSDECRIAALREKKREEYRRRYTPKPPSEYVCIDCGRTFLHQGRGCPKYCDACICKPVGRRAQYRRNRAKEVKK